MPPKCKIMYSCISMALNALNIEGQQIGMKSLLRSHNQTFVCHYCWRLACYDIIGDPQGAISSTKGQHVAGTMCCDYSCISVAGIALMWLESHIVDVICGWHHKHCIVTISFGSDVSFPSDVLLHFLCKQPDTWCFTQQTATFNTIKRTATSSAPADIAAITYCIVNWKRIWLQVLGAWMQTSWYIMTPRPDLVVLELRSLVFRASKSTSWIKSCPISVW
jgi:hypothetical protein